MEPCERCNDPSGMEQRDLFLDSYHNAVSSIPQIVEVRAGDRVCDVHVFTYYTGDAADFEDAVYDIEARTMDEYPNVRVNWHLIRV